MGTSSIIQASWEKFLQEVEFTRHYHRPPLLVGIGSTPFVNPMLEAMLPSLLYIKMFELFDDALEVYLKSQSPPLVPSATRAYDRIECLCDQGHAGCPRNDLHSIRLHRNELGHEPGIFTTWTRLDADIDTLDCELRHLKLVGPRPQYEYYGERSAMRNSEEPGVIWERDFEIGVRCDGNPVMSFSWSEKTLSSDSGK